MEQAQRYDDLDLECEASVSDRAAIFGGMFRRSSKHVAEPEDNSELSNSSDGLNDNPKGKGGVFKGILGQSTKTVKEGTVSQASLSVPSRELSASSDSLNDDKAPPKEKTGVFGGILKRSPKPGHSRSESQGNFSLDGNLNGSSDSLSENNIAKEKGSKFGGMFKKPNRTQGANSQFQDDMSASSEKFGSSDNLSEGKDAKEKGGVFGAVFKNPKSLFTRSQSREDLTSDADLSVSSDNLSKASLSVHSSELSASSDSLNNNNKPSKEKTGVLGGILKRTPKPAPRRRQSQDDLSLDGDLNGSNDILSENNSKEKRGAFGGMFKGWTKDPNSQSPDDLSGEMSSSTDILAEGKDVKDKGGVFSGVFKKPKWSKSREDLTADPELSTSGDNLSEKTSKCNNEILKNPFQSSAWDRSEQPADASEKLLVEEPKGKKQEKGPDCDGEEQNPDSQSAPKQNKLTGAMKKLNPFRSGNKYEKPSGSDEEPAGDEKTSSNKQKDTGQAETDKEVEKKQGEERREKSKPVKSTPTPREKTDRSGPPSVPVKPAKEDNKTMALRQKEKVASAAAGPTEEEPSRSSWHVLPKSKNENQDQSDEEVLNDSEGGRAVGEADTKLEPAAAKVRKPKRHNPFMPRVPDKDQSDDDLNKDAEEEGTGQAVAAKPKTAKKLNPFLPRVKVRPKKNPQKEPSAADNAAENEDRPLFDCLEDLIDRDEPVDRDVEGLMEWWSTVEGWEDMPQDDDMTEKEEAKAFALTAEKVQKGIRVFNKLFSERAESLWQHVIDLSDIADNLDRFNKNTKIAQITGGSTSAIGGVATITGLALAPVTMGVSLIITAVGLGVATAGGLTSAGAGISNQVNNSLDRKKVEKIVEDYQEKMADINKCMTFIKQGIESLRKFNLLKMRKHAYNQDFPALNNIYEDGAMVGKAILINANEIMRVVQIANVAGSTAARAVQIASMATGVLTGLFVGMDIYFVAKDSKELKKGAKSEFAAKIREVASQLHEGLVELNGIRDELQSTAGPGSGDGEAGLDNAPNKEDEEKKLEEDSDEDEIDRIKKAIKKDIENREYV